MRKWHRWLSGFSAFSGLWLYIQMWRQRKERALTPRWWRS